MKLESILNLRPVYKPLFLFSWHLFSRMKNKNIDVLECTKHVNKTDYDSLSGIIDRRKHPSIPEPEVALIFKRSDSDQVDMSVLETSLREAIMVVSLLLLLLLFLKQI